MLEKVKELFYKWCNKINELREDERYFLAFLTFLLPPVLIGLVLVLIIKAVSPVFTPATTSLLRKPCRASGV